MFPKRKYRKHTTVTLCWVQKEKSTVHFISDVKKPYLHNTFMFVGMLQLSIENHSIKTATCDLDSIFEVLSQIKISLSGLQCNFTAHPQRETLKGNRNEEWVMEREKYTSPPRASLHGWSIDPRHTSAGTTDGRGSGAGCPLHAPSHCLKAWRARGHILLGL